MRLAVVQGPEHDPSANADVLARRTWTWTNYRDPVGQRRDLFTCRRCATRSASALIATVLVGASSRCSRPTPSPGWTSRARSCILSHGAGDRRCSRSGSHSSAPLFNMWRNIGIYDTWLGLIIPYLTFDAAAVDLDDVGVLPADPVGDGAGRPGRRRHRLAGVPQGDRAAGRARRVHHRDPHVLLRWNDFLLAHLADLDRPRPHRARRAGVLHRRVAVPVSRSAPSWRPRSSSPSPSSSSCWSSSAGSSPASPPAPSRADARAQRPTRRSAWPPSRMKNIVKQYGDGFPAVNDVSLDIADGEFMILVGPSGLREVDAAADDRRPGGHHLRRHAHRRQAGQRQGAPRPQPGDGVPELRALPAPDRVREHRLPAAAAKNALRRRGPRAGSTRPPTTLELTEHLERKPANLSGGQRQRVAMGRAIVRAGRRVPLRRAAVQPRRQAARPDAHRDRPACSAGWASPPSTSPTTRPRR